MLRPSLLLMLARSGIGRLIFRLMLDRRVPVWSKLIIPGGLIYVLSPIDFMPDIIPILGWLDDIVAIVVTLTLFLLSIPSDLLREHLRGGGSQPPGNDGNVIDGTSRIVNDDDK